MTHEKKPTDGSSNASVEVEDVEIDIHEYANQSKDVPNARAYRIRIDGKEVRVETHQPTGELLLSKVGKRPCRFELIEEFVHHKNNVVEPSEVVELRKKGLKGFITAQREIVTLFINDNPYQINRGERNAGEIFAKVSQNPNEYGLFEERDGRLTLLNPDQPLVIHGCEVFRTKVLFDIQIDRTHFKVALNEMTGEQLRHLPTPTIGSDRDLFEVVPGGSDRKVADDQVVQIRNGLRFFTAPGQINPGSRN